MADERRADTNPATAEANADVLAEAASEQQQEETGTDDPAVPLPAPVDASKFEQPNEGPAPMVDLPDQADQTDQTDAGAEDVVDASAEIDF